MAEMLEGRREQFAAEVAAAEGGRRRAALAQVDAAIDRWVWYAGWADKYAQVAGGTNPVAGPYFNFSLPEPTGVVGVLAPQESCLLGLVSVLAPVLTHRQHRRRGGRRETRPLPAVSLAEVLATSDLPGGVVNLLTGFTRRARALAGRAPRRQRASTSPASRRATRADLQRAAADNVKRVYVPARRRTGPTTRAPTRLSAFVETKTVWHPIGV